MIITDQRIIEQVRVIPPRLNILQFRVEFDGTLTGIDIYLSAALTGFGFVYFGVRLNGTSIFATYPDDYINIPSGEEHGEATGLSIPVVKGDIISLDVLGNARKNLGAFLTFMCHIDNGVGAVPAGGTTGQVLTKQSNADGDADWEDASGGGGSSFQVYSPDPPYASPSTEDDEFAAGSLDGKWITNISNAPPTITWPIPNCASFTPVTGGSAQAIMQSVSNVDQTYRMKIILSKMTSSGNAIGFAVRSGSNRWDIWVFDAPNRYFRQFQCFNPNAVFMQNNVLDLSTSWANVADMTALYLELIYTATGTNCEFRYSMDGLTFRSIDSRSTVLGDPISHIGIHNQGSVTTPNHVDWFRKLQGQYTGGTV